MPLPVHRDDIGYSHDATGTITFTSTPAKLKSKPISLSSVPTPASFRRDSVCARYGSALKPTPFFPPRTVYTISPRMIYMSGTPTFIQRPHPHLPGNSPKSDDFSLVATTPLVIHVIKLSLHGLDLYMQNRASCAPPCHTVLHPTEDQ